MTTTMTMIMMMMVSSLNVQTYLQGTYRDLTIERHSRNILTTIA